jgi:hypothetical protein
MIAKRRTLLFALSLAIATSLTAQPRSRSAQLAQTYGTTARTYVSVSSAGFGPTNSDIHYQREGFNRYAQDCDGPCFMAPLALPAGARLVYLELDFVDNNPLWGASGSLVICDYDGQNCTQHPSAGSGPADCLAPGSICSGKASVPGAYYGSADLEPDGVVVDNYLNTYRLQGGACCDSSVQLAGMIVGYVLQVSPSPAVADFDDVPTTHPYFQYIEALKHAGITGGCIANPPQFCPDRPITRGEMAVFLSIALGLHFQ